MADQLRASALGCYGNDFVLTPHLDRLAREGARFETAVSPCAVCMPARSAVLAGQYARAANGTLGNVSVAGDPTFSRRYYPQAKHDSKRQFSCDCPVVSGLFDNWSSS